MVNDLEERASEAEALAEEEERRETKITVPEDSDIRNAVEKLKRSTREVNDGEIESMFSSLR